jgi:hypothetical protein
MNELMTNLVRRGKPSGDLYEPRCHFFDEGKMSIGSQNRSFIPNRYYL